MAGEYQKELFKEFKKEKGKFEKIADKIILRRKRLYFHLPLENIVFAVIVVIIFVIVAFAFGVERGKRLTPALTEKKTASAKDEIMAHQIELKPIEVGEAAPESSPLPAERELSYTIQLISYKQKILAEREEGRLLNKKVEAFIIPSGNWYQVCAGRYGTVEEAKVAQKEFLKDYKGCFIRKGVK